MNWKVGDRAIIVEDGHTYAAKDANAFGRCCTIIGPGIGLDWEVDVDGINHKHAEVNSCVLRPIDDYDGHEITSWEECIWQPKVMA